MPVRTDWMVMGEVDEIVTGEVEVVLGLAKVMTVAEDDRSAVKPVKTEAVPVEVEWNPVVEVTVTGEVEDSVREVTAEVSVAGPVVVTVSEEVDVKSTVGLAVDTYSVGSVSAVEVLLVPS